METNKLKELRTNKKLSLRKLAAKADLDQSTISKIENGHTKAQRVTLVKLAEALDVPFSELEEYLDTGAAERGKKGGINAALKNDRLAAVNV